ncbi:hypothetical protein T4A_9955 [Trichinella pseudospiralis]|uniref:Uncharacterized protein n=1 Tax=Trichinella pseudospiralis TaxID=6337 RepID=A0A0V1DU54_TRIPS|nr:hypothetical protein T4A_9955 [Trichinella pseudospiralis]
MLQKLLLLSACVEHIFEARHINTTTTFVGCETFTFVQKASSQAIQARLNSLAFVTGRLLTNFQHLNAVPLRVDGVGFPVELVARACRCPQAAVSGDV